MSLERLLTVRELAELLGFQAGTIVDWSERGELPGYRIGGRLRFKESEVAEWLERRRKGPSAAEEVAPVPYQSPGPRRSLTTAPVPLSGGEDHAS